jgi:hypothetical protein
MGTKGVDVLTSSEHNFAITQWTSFSNAFFGHIDHTERGG